MCLLERVTRARVLLDQQPGNAFSYRWPKSTWALGSRLRTIARAIWQQTNLTLILPSSQLNNMFCLIVDREPAKKVVLFTSVISLLHAVVNPPLYGWMSQRYRRGYLFVFKLALSVCGGTRPNRRSLSKFLPPVLPLSSPGLPIPQFSLKTSITKNVHNNSTSCQNFTSKFPLLKSDDIYRWCNLAVNGKEWIFWISENLTPKKRLANQIIGPQGHSVFVPNLHRLRGTRRPWGLKWCIPRAKMGKAALGTRMRKKNAFYSAQFS